MSYIGQSVPSVAECRLRLVQANVKAGQDLAKQIDDDRKKYIDQSEQIEQLTKALAEANARAAKTREQVKKEVEIEMGRRGRLTTADLRIQFEKFLEKEGIEPAQELVRMVMAQDEQGRFALSPDQRIKILLELNQYRMPKLKATENTGTVQHDHRVVIVKYGEKLPEADQSLELPRSNRPLIVDVEPEAPQ